MGNGHPPEPWANLIAEFMVTDFARSLDFRTGLLGFSIAFLRPAQSLACLTRREGAQVMIYPGDGNWETGPMDPPFGRGPVTQIFVADVRAVNETVTAAGYPCTCPCARNGATGATFRAASESS